MAVEAYQFNIFINGIAVLVTDGISSVKSYTTHTDKDKHLQAHHTHWKTSQEQFLIHTGKQTSFPLLYAHRLYRVHLYHKPKEEPLIWEQGKETWSWATGWFSDYVWDEQCTQSC